MPGRHIRGASTVARVSGVGSHQDKSAPVTLRPAGPADAETCGKIIYEAFRGIALRHGFAPDFPSVEAGVTLARSLIANPTVFGVVAETDGQIVGSNFIGKGDPICGVGPITVTPDAQGDGIGRLLMQAVIKHANGARGIRLLQDAFNMASISLYGSLGFEVREPVLVMSGRPQGKPAAGVTVRPLRLEDLVACDALCMQVHGISRRQDVADAVRLFAPLAAERDGRITAYLTAPTFWLANHAVAESEADLETLLLAAAALTNGPIEFLLPTRQAGLFRWCLEHGMRAQKPMTLMTIGEYRPPAQPYLPSVFY